MITYRTYNTKIKSVPAWPTCDGVPSMEIHDPENRYVFEIVFGPKPKVAVFANSDEHNLNEEIHSWDNSVEELPSIEISDLAEALDRCQMSGHEAGATTKDIIEMIIGKNAELGGASGSKIGNYLKTLFCRIQRDK